MTFKVLILVAIMALANAGLIQPQAAITSYAAAPVTYSAPAFTNHAAPVAYSVPVISKAVAPLAYSTYSVPAPLSYAAAAPVAYGAPVISAYNAAW